MEIRVNYTTGDIRKKEDILRLCQAHAKVCRSEKDFEEIEKEPLKMRFIEGLVAGGEHTPFEFFQMDFYLNGLSKILMMILNNEKQYSTCEKSARFTRMESEGIGKEKYEKWRMKLAPLIDREFPDIRDKSMREKAVEKMAMDYARYMTSVFTPGKMCHSLNLRQLNYLLGFFEEAIPQYMEGGRFKRRLAGEMECFVRKIRAEYPDFIVDGLRSMTDRHLTLFRAGNCEEYFGDVYSANYDASIASVAQIHRSRSIKVVITSNPDSGHSYAVPMIIMSSDSLRHEWMSDIEEVAENDPPQGLKVHVNESGELNDFKSKLLLRLCGHAHLETMTINKRIAERYSQKVHEVAEWIKTPCSQDYHCHKPCAWGKRALERII